MPNPLYLPIRDIVSSPRFVLEDLCRSQATGYYLGEHTVLCRILGKYKFYVDSRDGSLAPHLIMDGFWESWITRFVGGIVKPDDVCIDLGANFGYYSVLMAGLSGEMGRTIAVEANPNLCRLVERSASINGLPIETINKAVSNKNQKVTLTVPNGMWGDGSIREGFQNADSTRLKVQAVPLDALVQELALSRVDVVKMDCEGMEPAILEGMQQTIRANPGIRIIMEFTPFDYQDSAGFVEYLYSVFEVSRIEGDSGTRLVSAEELNRFAAVRQHADLYLTVRKP